MSKSGFPSLDKHRRFIISRIFSVQLVIMIIIAMAAGITGISTFRSLTYEKTSSNTLAVANCVENYVKVGILKDQEASEKVISSGNVQEYIDGFGDTLNICIYIFSSDNKCMLCSKNSDLSMSEVSIPYSVIKSMRKSSSAACEDISVSLNPKDTRPSVSKCIRFTIAETDNSESEYFIVTCSYSNKIEYFTRRILIACFVSITVLITLFALFIFRFVKRHYIEPQESIGIAIRKYSQGDYSEMLDLEQFHDPYYRENASVINQIVSNLKTTCEQQSQFIANVSHELRTPMTIISGYVNGMLDGTIPKEKRTEYLYIVSQEMQRLKILVSSMLNLTKFDNGTIQINRKVFSLNDLVFRTFLMFESRIEKRNITVLGLDCDTVYIYGDNGLIGQVIYNLTENAVKFVNTGGTITIRMEETKDASVFAIRNTGSGISKDELPKIFERFYKSDSSRSQDKTGLGLGLDIIKKILRLHDAQISVSSEENVFTEFSVSFPKKPETHD